MKKILILIFILAALLHARNGFVIVNEKAQENSVSVQKGAYKILEFDKMISKVKVNDSKNIEVSFVKNRNKPLHTLRVYAKSIGSTTIFINFSDQTNTQVEFSVVKDLTAIIILIHNRIVIIKLSGKN